MAEYLSGKMKRKELDEVYDDFSDLCITVPAMKIRRLDSGLLPIADEREPFLGKQLRDEEMCSGLAAEAVPPPALNEERALVMYKPPDAYFAPSLKVSPKLITSLKNYAFWPRNPNMVAKEEEGYNCLAVVPWVPSHILPVTLQAKTDTVSASATSFSPTCNIDPFEEDEPMEAEEAAAALMEVEEDSGSSGAQGDQQWRQQHCIASPQLLQMQIQYLMADRKSVS